MDCGLHFTRSAARDQNFSILKPKLPGSLVRVHGPASERLKVFTSRMRLQSKPELNGLGASQWR